MKKILSVLLILLLMFVQTMPVMAKSRQSNININFTKKFNVNKSNLGDTVVLKLKEPTTVSGFEIPAGTQFYGKIEKIRHSQGGFISANARITLNEMVLPSGQTIPMQGYADDIPIKSSMLANIGKGVITTPITILGLTFGGIWIAVECISIIGIIFVPQTIATVGHTVATTTKGVNRKVSVRKDIKVPIDAPQVKTKNN